MPSEDPAIDDRYDPYNVGELTLQTEGVSPLTHPQARPSLVSCLLITLAGTKIHLKLLVLALRDRIKKI